MQYFKFQMYGYISHFKIAVHPLL